MYNIGDKVETPLGVGVIKWIDKASENEDEGFDTVYVSIEGLPEIEFNERHIKPYQSAHDKFIASGYVKKVNKTTVDYIKETKDTYRRYGNRITIHLKEKLYSGIAFNDDLFNSQYHKSEMAFSLELSRILTRYLEELE